jgi:hypothetical protein
MDFLNRVYKAITMFVPPVTMIGNHGWPLTDLTRQLTESCITGRAHAFVPMPSFAEANGTVSLLRAVSARGINGSVAYILCSTVFTKHFTSSHWWFHVRMVHTALITVSSHYQPKYSVAYNQTTPNLIKYMLNAVFWDLTLTSFLARRFLSPWWWRRYIPPKRRFLQEPHNVTSQKTPFFIVTAVKTSNLTYLFVV